MTKTLIQSEILSPIKLNRIDQRLNKLLKNKNIETIAQGDMLRKVQIL